MENSYDNFIVFVFFELVTQRAAQNILFCVVQEKVSQTGLEHHEVE